VWQHREGVVLGFTKTYRVHRLVYFEAFGSIVDTIEREKRMKKWRRDWKIRLIAEANPHWVDLYDNLAR
jgi:putative endonuclease